MPLEIQAAFDRVATDSAPGPDEHQPAVYELGGATMQRILTAVFRKCWRMGQTPSQWKESHVRMLHNAGDVSDVEAKEVSRARLASHRHSLFFCL
jgi:hypothetical protein